MLVFLRIGAGALEITGCWTNVSAPDAQHRMDTHPNSFLSGGSYVDVADGAATINLTRARSRSSSGRLSPPRAPTSRTSRAIRE